MRGGRRERDFIFSLTPKSGQRKQPHSGHSRLGDEVCHVTKLLRISVTFVLNYNLQIECT